MKHADFQHVDTWVFDLDHTLYPPSARLFDLIEVRMTDYVMNALGVEREEADRLRAHYWKTHGTTLAGLMREHDVDPAPYLEDVHDISLDHLELDTQLARAIRALPGRRIVYTNGTAPYAERVVKARGLDGLFDAVYGVDILLIPYDLKAYQCRGSGMIIDGVLAKKPIIYTDGIGMEELDGQVQPMGVIMEPLLVKTTTVIGGQPA